MTEFRIALVESLRVQAKDWVRTHHGKGDDPEFYEGTNEWEAANLIEAQAERLERVEGAAREVVYARYGIAPLPDGISGSPADNELDDAIVNLQVVVDLTTPTEREDEE